MLEVLAELGVDDDELESAGLLDTTFSPIRWTSRLCRRKKQAGAGATRPPSRDDDEPLRCGVYAFGAGFMALLLTAIYYS